MTRTGQRRLSRGPLYALVGAAVLVVAGIASTLVQGWALQHSIALAGTSGSQPMQTLPVDAYTTYSVPTIYNPLSDYHRLLAFEGATAVALLVFVAAAAVFITSAVLQRANGPSTSAQ